MRTARFLVPIALLAVLLAGCGGGSSAVALAPDDVATVGNQHITKSDFDDLMQEAKANMKAQGQKFPKEGTSDYASLKSQAVDLLVQQSEKEQKATAEGITVTDKQVDKQLTALKKQYFGGSEKKYEAQLKKQKLTDAQIRRDLRHQLYSTAISAHVTKGIAVTDDDIHAYYVAHIADYVQPKSRDVQYILVKKKALAQSLYTQLKNGNAKTWCTLAKKYSQDSSSSGSCGKATFSKGQTVAAFDKALFAGTQNVVHAPVHSSEYGWFLLMPTSKVKPSSTTPEKKVKATIKQTLLSQKKDQAVTDWANDVLKSYCSGSKVKYQVGYAPSPDPCTATTSTDQTAT
jgi:parvulin-like peptidyl-prolyl isomerase